MNRLQIHEINTLARLPLMDPLLNAFRTRMLIAYAIGVGYFKGSIINGCDIKDGWLTIKEDNNENLPLLLRRNTTLRIPLHPIILKIFEAYNNDIPTFTPEDTKTFLKKLAVEMSRHVKDQDGEDAWHRRLFVTFRAPFSGFIELLALGLSEWECFLLNGAASSQDYPVISPEIKDLFFHQFFDFLMPLAAQYGIDWEGVMGLYNSESVGTKEK